MVVGKDTYCWNGNVTTFWNLYNVDSPHNSIASLPFSLRVLLENILRTMPEGSDKESLIQYILGNKHTGPAPQFDFYPARVLIHDFTGVPIIADLAAMRNAMEEAGHDAACINPVIPVGLSIDHSMLVDYFGCSKSQEQNRKLEYLRNEERFSLLKWASSAMDNLTVSPPNKGICHQLHLEYLSPCFIHTTKDGKILAFPDTLVGADSHTGTLSGMGVLSFGVGGIEVESMMLGEPYSMTIPEVVGVRLLGRLPQGVTATDLALTLTALLRKEGVVEAFVEYTGPGLKNLSVPARCTVANMAPEYGATIGYFPIDAEVLRYLGQTGRTQQAQCTELFAQRSGLFATGTETLSFNKLIEFDLQSVEPCIAGPSQPKQYIALRKSPQIMKTLFQKESCPAVPVPHEDGTVAMITHGAVALAAITSCTNTINPDLIIGAALLARNAVQAGLQVPHYVKTVFAPGSATVTQYLENSGLLPYLQALGFHTVGYSCLTCIGNSGPLTMPMSTAVIEHELNVAAVLSANRNFEARVNPLIRSNFLASPMLVVAYALAGSVQHDFEKEPIGYARGGNPVYLKDIIPTDTEIETIVQNYVTPEVFTTTYDAFLEGDTTWQNIPISGGSTFTWDCDSTYIKKPPYFTEFTRQPEQRKDICGARVLAFFGDNVTTDHISPSGVIPEHYPAGRYLLEKGVAPKDFNIYGTRRGNHEVMMRGTFANIRLKNLLVAPKEGAYTKKYPQGEEMFIFDAAKAYGKEQTPLIILAGKEYGTGSSRDWAAKGPYLLGVQAVIARSFERIHRNNLVGMGILPLQFMEGASAQSLGLVGDELFDLSGICSLESRQKITVMATQPGGKKVTFPVLVRLDSPLEVSYFTNGGILPYVLRRILASRA